MPLPIDRFPLMNPEPGDTGAGLPPADPAPADPAPAPADPAPSPAAPATPAAAAPAEPADPFAGLDKALDAISETPGQPRVAGKFASSSQVKAGVATTPAPPAATPAPTAAPKPGDIDLTPPEGMNPRASERWSQLTERAKMVPVLEQRVQQTTTALESVRQLVNNSGLDANEFTGLLDVGRLYKSDSPQDQRLALQRLDAMRAEVAMRLGVDVPGVDQLAEFPDLQQRVDNMLMTREDALGYAHARRQAAQGQQITDSQRELAQHQHNINQASASMAQTLAKRAGTPGHEAKLQHIVGWFQDPVRLQAFVNTYHPQQWEPALLLMYDNFNPPPPAPPAVQPLRPGAFAAGTPVRTGPATAGSAVESAFARAGI